MVMSNQFDLIGDTDIDDPLQIALAQIEIGNKKPVPVAAPELPVKETQKGVSSVPHGGVPYQGRRGQDGRGWGPGRNFESNRYVDGFSAVPEDSAGRRGQDGCGWGPDRNFESNRYVGGFSAVPEGSTQGKPSIRGHSDQPYRSRGGRGRGYLNRDNGEYAGRPARRQFERRSGISSPPAKVKGEPAPPVKDEPVPPVELGTTDKLSEQNLKENATLEGKSMIPEEPVELKIAPSSIANKEDKEGMANGIEEKEPEVEVMTLEEYEKVLAEKRRTLVAMKTQERKVDVDKEFESMRQLLVKKENNEFFVKLRNDKEAGKRKEDTVRDERVKKDTDRDESVKKDTDRDERVKKTVSMNEFLKLAEGERGRRGRGHSGYHGRGGRFSAPSIKDPQQFPALGGKLNNITQHNDNISNATVLPSNES